jgi:NAD(P)-dependent dehydrogenase (short-subunit alcohol dehydrogenase family)
MTFVDQTFSLRGKTALVTGAGRGVGLAIATGLLRAEATVLMVDFDPQTLDTAASALKLEGLAAHGYLCDLSQPPEIDNLANTVAQQFSHIDVLVNNAGITLGHDLFEYPLTDWERTLGINLRAPFLLTQRIALLMRDHGGSVINMTSINAELGFPSNPAYAAAKGGLRQLTKSLAVDLGKYGIRVNNIGPGYVETDMTAKSYANPDARQQRTQRTILGRWATPQDIVGLAIFLASDASSYITGQDIYIDGGWLARGL